MAGSGSRRPGPRHRRPGVPAGRRGAVVAAVLVVAAAATVGGAWAGFTSDAPVGDQVAGAGTLTLDLQARYGDGRTAPSAITVDDVRPGSRLADYTLVATNRGSLAGVLSLRLLPGEDTSAVAGAAGAARGAEEEAARPRPSASRTDSASPSPSGVSSPATAPMSAATSTASPAGAGTAADAALARSLLVTVIADGGQVRTDLPLRELASAPLDLGSLSPREARRVTLRIRVPEDADPRIRYGRVRFAFEMALDQRGRPASPRG